MIEIEFRDESDKVLFCGLSIPAAIFPDIFDETYTCLRFVDPYADTVFNQAQLPCVLADLSRLKASGSSNSFLNVLLQLEEEIRRYQNEPHVYLRFVGD